MDMQDRFKINSPDVIYENIDNEILIIEFNTGNYYSLDNTGAEIWEMLASGTAIKDIISALKQKYPKGNGDIQNGVQQLVNELKNEKLIIPSETGTNENINHFTDNKQTESSGDQNFIIPVLQKYSDMQDLLLLDPIHEVDETGWPTPKDI